jgi:predicted porin
MGYALNPQTSAYVGAAWEHEYDGKAKACILYDEFEPIS